MITAPKTQSSSLRVALNRISLPNVIQSDDQMTTRRESRSRFFYVTATLFMAATVMAFIEGRPARTFLLGAVLSYGFGVMITTLEDLLELLNAYWAARSATEWENYASRLHGRASLLQRAVVRGTDKVFGPIGNDRDLKTIDPPSQLGADSTIGDNV